MSKRHALATGGAVFIDSHLADETSERGFGQLQSFPDDCTPVADSPRFKALGNSMVVPVMCSTNEEAAMVECINDDAKACGEAVGGGLIEVGKP